MPGSHPRLPDAERVADRVADDVREWDRGRASAPRRWIRGQRGVGKSYAASRVVEVAKELDISVLEIRPPKLGLDSFAQLSLQGAGSLREAKVNGALDPAFRADASWDEKRTALLEGLREADEPGLLLLDLPSSWDRDPETPDHRRTQAVAMRCVRELTSTAQDRGWAVLLATSHRWSQASWLGDPTPEDIPRRSEGEAFLRDASNWGAHTAAGAERLADQLGRVASDCTPLELRVAVALSTLRDPPMLYVVEACEAGLPMLRQRLAQALDHHQQLQRMFELLSLARFPVDAQMAEGLADHLDEVDRDVLCNALVLRSADGWVVHESIRAEPLEHARERRTHEWLFDAFADGGPIECRRAAIRTLERLHHAAAAGRVDLVPEDDALPDVAVLLELGRSLSLRGEYGRAAEVYERALALDPANTYAKEYGAFNHERAGGARKRALELFADAVHDERDNPWWNRRLVVAYVRRGRIKQAGHAFRAALKSFSDSPQPPNRRWLADNFHVGIAQELLRRAQLPLAREVLGSVPTEVRDASDEIAELYNRLRHREEAERWGVSVFPEDIPFETRWDGPHFAPESAGRKLAPGARWFPARIVQIGEDALELEVGELGDDQTPTYTRRPISEEDFLEAANRRNLRDVFEGQYLDVIVEADGTTTTIYLREQQATPRPRDPWDILQGWKPDVDDRAAE